MKRSTSDKRSNPTAAAPNDADPQPQIVETAGELLDDGRSGIELIRTKGDKPELLRWQKGRKPISAPQILQNGKLFTPISADVSLWRATKLPSGLNEQGSPPKLFEDLVDLFVSSTGWPETQVLLIVGWVFVTWFSGVLANPLTLVFYGMEMNRAIQVFELLECVCWRPLMLSEAKQSDLSWLMKIKPTFLLNQPLMPARFRRLLQASNYRSVLMPGPGETVFNASCCKAMFLPPSRAWSEPGIHIPLSLTNGPVRFLDRKTKGQIIDRFQNSLLWYRLNNMQPICESRFANGGSEAYSPRDLAALLQLSTSNNDEAGWELLLQTGETEARQQQYLDPKVIAVEFVWPLWHLPSPEDIREKDVTDAVNTTLLTRGEVRQYLPQEIGDRLQELGFKVTRRGPGMYLILQRDNLRLLHRWAKEFGIGNAVEGCLDCVEAQIPKSQSV